MAIVFNTEYRIMEVSRYGKRYDHPWLSPYDNKDEALNSLRATRGRYSRYGRKFYLTERVVSEWQRSEKETREHRNFQVR